MNKLSNYILSLGLFIAVEGIDPVNTSDSVKETEKENAHLPHFWIWLRVLGYSVESF